MSPSNIDCSSCKQPITIRDFLAACSNYWADIDAVKFTCPQCRHETYARIETSAIWLGYVYAAGCAHFCGMEEIKVEGLQAWREGDGLGVQLSEEEWVISSKAS